MNSSAAPASARHTACHPLSLEPRGAHAHSKENLLGSEIVSITCEGLALETSLCLSDPLTNAVNRTNPYFTS